MFRRCIVRYTYPNHPSMFGIFTIIYLHLVDFHGYLQINIPVPWILWVEIDYTIKKTNELWTTEKMLKPRSKTNPWIILVLVTGGRDYICQKARTIPGKTSGIYCQLGEYVLPGDSSRDLFIPKRWRSPTTPWKGHFFTIPKRSRLESPGTYHLLTRTWKIRWRNQQFLGLQKVVFVLTQKKAVQASKTGGPSWISWRWK